LGISLVNNSVNQSPIPKSEMFSERYIYLLLDCNICQTVRKLDSVI